jgi:hypothetical protein
MITDAVPVLGVFLATLMALFGAIEPGFDYLYRLDSKWELGFQLDLNYDRTFKHQEGHHESDAIVPIVSYSVTDRLPVILARTSHQVSSRGRRGAVLSWVFDPRGAEAYLTVR